jgi:hypothetical protein
MLFLLIRWLYCCRGPQGLGFIAFGERRRRGWREFLHICPWTACGVRSCG